MLAKEKIHVMVFAFNRSIPLRIVVDCFLCQTYPNWHMTIIHDGPATQDVYRVVFGYPQEVRLQYVQTEVNNGGFGFPNRKWFLEQKAKEEEGSWLLFCSDDSYYVPTFLENMMLLVREDTGIIYCDSVHAHKGHDVLKGELKVSSIDMGQFLVRYDVAKKNGFNFTQDNIYFADGVFAEECHATAQKMGLKAAYMPRPLLVKN